MSTVVQELLERARTRKFGRSKELVQLYRLAETLSACRPSFLREKSLKVESVPHRVTWPSLSTPRAFADERDNGGSLDRKRVFWRPRCQKVELDHLYRLAEPDLARTPSFSREKSLFVQAGPAVTETPGCNTAVGHFNGLVLGTESVPEHKNAAKKSALASSFRRYAL